MNVPAPTLDDESRRALFAGLASLDDPSRGLLLDHYFEGATLDALASREGVSPQAVSKRLDRAREELRRKLPASLAAIDLNRLFEPGIAAATPDLVSGPVLAKAASATAGTALAIKIAVGLAAVIAVAFLFERLTRFATPGDLAPIESTVLRSTTSSNPLSPGLPQPGQGIPETAFARAKTSSLQGRLVRFRDWVLARNEERDRIRPEDQRARESFAEDRHRGLILELKGLAEQVSEDPETFFRFLEDPANECCVLDLAWAGFGYFYIEPGAGYAMGMPLDCASLPPKVVEGFLDLLRDGTAVLKQASLFFFSTLRDRPSGFWKQLPAAIRDAEPRVASQAIKLVWPSTTAPPEVVDAVLVAGRTSAHVEVRRGAADTMANLQVPEAQEFLLERMETVKDPYELFSAVLGMSAKFLAASRGGAPVDEARFLQASLAIAGRKIEGGYQKWLVGTVLYVPPGRSRPVIERALASASDDGTRAALTAVLAQVDSGVTDREVLQKLLWP